MNGRHEVAPFTLRIERFAHGGEGVGHHPDGRVVFVPRALPGELVEVRRVEGHRRWMRAQTSQVLDPSPIRRTPPCPVANRCGGCAWMVLPEQEQQAAKLTLLGETLSRGLGRDHPLPPMPWPLWTGKTLGARCRVRLHRNEAGDLGFFEEGGRRVVAVDRCTVADPRIQALMPAVRDAVRLPGGRAIHTVDLRIDDDGALQIGVGAAERPGDDCWVALSNLGQVGPLDGAGPRQRFALPGGVALRPSPGAFVQVHSQGNEALVSAVVDGARDRGARWFLDLYCGAGNFALALGAAGLSGYGYEGSAAAVADARVAAKEFLLDQRLTFEAGELDDLVAAAPTEPDLVVVDPPRAGAPQIGTWMRHLRPRSVAMVSCEPSTLVRDLQAVLPLGYRIDSVRAFDLFPQTPHVETLVWLSSGA